MHEEILSHAQQSALALLSRPPELQSFYLAGGTALALHLGHRESVDLDFFREQPFEPQRLLEHLPTPPPVKVLQAERDTLTVEFREVKVSFFGYPHALIKPLISTSTIRAIADIPDIAAMKLTAIAGRGSRKDFVDMYCICRECFSLKEAFVHLQTKFPAHQYDLYHILRSLTFFEDAEAEPMPRMKRAIGWDTIKHFFIAEASRLRL